MKKLILAILGLSLTLQTRAQWTVFDPAVFAQVVENLLTAKNQLDQLQTQVKRLGDPAAVKELAGLAPVLQGLGRGGLKEKGESLQQSLSTTMALWDGGDKIYRTVGERIVLPDGQEVLRRIEDYTKFANLVNSLMDFKSVHEDTDLRRQTILKELEQTATRLRSAPTMAEVEKLQAVIQAQQTILDAVDRERDAAFQRLTAADLANKADDMRQQNARREDKAAGLFHGAIQLQRFLEVDVNPVTIPMRP